MKYFVMFAFVLIIGSLASALFFMMRGNKQHGPDANQSDQRKSANMVRALALRVGLSIILFVCILVAWKLGYIQPTGIPAGA
jgi:Protein of unknown function (DUF2909)